MSEIACAAAAASCRPTPLQGSRTPASGARTGLRSSARLRAGRICGETSATSGPARRRRSRRRRSTGCGRSTTSNARSPAPRRGAPRHPTGQGAAEGRGVPSLGRTATDPNPRQERPRQGLPLRPRPLDVFLSVPGGRARRPRHQRCRARNAPDRCRPRSPLCLNQWRKMAHRLFAGADTGGETLARALTVIETAKMNGLDPKAHLAHVLHRIHDHKQRRLDELLPWNRGPNTASRIEAPEPHWQPGEYDWPSPGRQAPRPVEACRRSPPVRFACSPYLILPLTAHNGGPTLLGRLAPRQCLTETR